MRLRETGIDVAPNPWGWNLKGISRWMRYGWGLRRGVTTRVPYDADFVLGNSSDTELARYRQVGPVVITRPVTVRFESLVN